MSKCGLFWVGETWFWVGGGAWGHMGHCFGKVVVSRGKWALFWVNVGGWAIILDGWRWVGHYFG